MSRITGVEGADMMIAFLKAPGHTLELIEYRAPASKGAVRGAAVRHRVRARRVSTSTTPKRAVAAVQRYGVTPIPPPVTIDQGPNKRKVVYARLGRGDDRLIEVATK